MEYKIPELKGTDKQIKWATDILTGALKQLEIIDNDVERRYPDGGKVCPEYTHEGVKAYRDDLINNTFKQLGAMPSGSAALVIDKRFVFDGDYIRKAVAAISQGRTTF